MYHLMFAYYKVPIVIAKGQTHKTNIKEIKR
jgi:hypothetical protein